MRELKFRYWSKYANKHWYDHELELNEDTDDVYVCDIFKTPPEGCYWEQWTGLKDKNGVDIYEGDVCHALGGVEHQGYREFDSKGIIVFTSGAFLFKDKKDIHYDLGHIEEIEVIGNIHQNNK